MQSGLASLPTLQPTDVFAILCSWLAMGDRGCRRKSVCEKWREIEDDKGSMEIVGGVCGGAVGGIVGGSTVQGRRSSRARSAAPAYLCVILTHQSVHDDALTLSLPFPRFHLFRPPQRPLLLPLCALCFWFSEVRA